VARSIPAEQIAEVQAATDIVELISSYVPLKRRGKDYLALCPFHQEKTPSFSVSPTKQIFYCFGCGAGGDVISFLMKHERMEFVEAVQHLADRAGIRLRHATERDSRTARVRQDLYGICQWADDEFHRLLVASPKGKAALGYLEQRGLTGETIEAFHLGFAPDEWDYLLGRATQKGISGRQLEQVGLAVARDQSSGHYDRFRNRAIFPIRDARGRTVAFGGRAMGDDRAKYLNSPETPLFHKGRTLYGLDTARDAIAREGRVCVVEGYMDLVMAHQHGVPWVVATLGTALTESHLHLLRRFADVAVLVFDGDTAGREATNRGIELFLRQELEVRVCVLPAATDPCDFVVEHGGEALLAELDRAPTAFEYKLAEIEAKYDVTSDTEKRRAIDEALGMLATLPARTRSAWAVRRDMMLAALARRMGVGEAALRTRLAGLARRHDRRVSAPAAPAPVKGFERELIEILVCSPDLFDDVRSLLPPESMRDEALAGLAAAIYEMMDGGASPDLRQVLATAAEAGAADLASDLAGEGAAKGRFQERLDAVARRFADRSAKRRRAELRAQLDQVTSESQRAELLRELSEIHRSAGTR